jgi:hypothetical protein
MTITKGHLELDRLKVSIARRLLSILAAEANLIAMRENLRCKEEEFARQTKRLQLAGRKTKKARAA